MRFGCWIHGRGCSSIAPRHQEASEGLKSQESRYTRHPRTNQYHTSKQARHGSLGAAAADGLHESLARIRSEPRQNLPPTRVPSEPKEKLTSLRSPTLRSLESLTPMGSSESAMVPDSESLSTARAVQPWNLGS